MNDIELRKIGKVGRVTLNRPEALNALTLDMVLQLRRILPTWAEDDDVSMLVIDAKGDRAFCAGGDITDIYDAIRVQKFDQARQFWRDEYPLNAALFNFPKPVATFLQGFTMGGGVGVGCHASHRVVCENSKIAMPECSIGLVPDIGGSLILARAPGRLGEFLGLTAHRMDAGDAIEAGFADYYIPAEFWPDLISSLEERGDWTEIDNAAINPPESWLGVQEQVISSLFTGETLRDVMIDVRSSDHEIAKIAMDRMTNHAPLAMACAVELIHRARGRDSIEEALKNEFRFAYRIAAHEDFPEGIRAAVIERDKSPKWAHSDLSEPTLMEVSAMLRPLGNQELEL